MSKRHLKDLNQKRKGAYYKDPAEENFLEELNEYLQPRELDTYLDIAPPHPHIFIFGLPRSGTTLLSQVIAHGLDVGYINNFVARFWLAPVHGIKLSQSILKKEPEPSFRSDFGATGSLKDIHEFGYFWRKWLHKDALEGIKNAESLEDKIDWEGLVRSLANIQAELDKPMVYKNIFGAYHTPRLTKALNTKALWIYIERDPLDVAVSILNARKKFYHDINTWWSYAPPNYEELLKLDHWGQIAGQIHYLKEYYYQQIERMESIQPVLPIKYEQLTQDPVAVLNIIRKTLHQRFSTSVNLKADPSEAIEHRSYGPSKEKEIFADRLSKLSSNG